MHAASRRDHHQTTERQDESSRLQVADCSMSHRPSLFQRFLDESSSDDADEFFFAAAQIVQRCSQPARKHGGSVPGHQVKYRDRVGGHARMYQDYLADDPTYDLTDFRRRFICICLLL